jgi:hypothetical protein
VPAIYHLRMRRREIRGRNPASGELAPRSWGLNASTDEKASTRDRPGAHRYRRRAAVAVGETLGVQPPLIRRRGLLHPARNRWPIRIGYSGIPDYFVDTMNLNSHDRGYRLLATVDGGRAAERQVHARFRHLRIHGTWFLAESELLAHIEGIVGPSEPEARTSTRLSR